MADPLSDPRAQGLLSADPGEISLLAGSFHRVANQAHTAAAGLRGAENDAHWTGQAADAFRAKLGKLPGDLDNVQSSYGEVAGALDTYGAHLEPIQTKFQSLATQLGDARSSLANAQGQAATAQSNLSKATAAPHATSHTTAVVNAHSALNAANTRVGNLQQQVSGLESRGFQLLDEFDTIRTAAINKVSDAAGKAPSHHWWQSVASFVGNFVKETVENIGKSVWDLVSGKDIIAFIEHPGWATLGTLVKDIAITASLVAMIAAPFAAPELAGLDAAEDVAATLLEDGAADAAEDAAGDALGDAVTDTTEDATTDSSSSTFGNVARGVNTWGNRVSTAGNVFGVGDEVAQGHYGAAAMDAGMLLVPNLGSTGKAIGAIKGVDSFGDALALVPKAIDHAGGFGDDLANSLHVGDDAADEAVETASNVTYYKAFREFGLSDSLAKKVAFGDDEVPALHVDWNAKALNAANTANRIGKPLAGAFDKLVTEPINDEIQHKLHLVPDDG